MWFIIVVKTLLILPWMVRVPFTTGIDYNAYLEQASAVYHGERDYLRISSQQGPAYYPAGHLFIYLPFFMLHYHFEAEIFIRGIHLVMSLVVSMVATKLAFMYFEEEEEDQPKSGIP